MTFFAKKKTYSRSKHFPLQYGENNPFLRTQCLAVDDIDDETNKLIEALGALTWEYEGVGLSAPQIGCKKRIISTTTWKDNARGTKCTGQTIMINPEIIKASDKMFISYEGCLSLPNMFGDVLRHHAVAVRYLSVDGLWQEQKLKGFNAAIVQHEIDHLNGILFVDKLIT